MPLTPAQEQRRAALVLRAPPAPSHAMGVTLGDGAVELVGVDVAPHPVPRGSKLRLTWYWRCLRRLDRDWRVFVHVEAADRRTIVVNGDHAPGEGLLPTSRWEPGRVYADPHELAIPASAPPELQVMVGLFRPGDRLPVDDAGRGDGRDRIRGPRVPVAGAEPGLPGYLAPRAGQRPTIDGRLDDPTWAAAPWTPAFVRARDGGPAPLATRAKLVWDDERLYVAFQVEDPDVWARLTEDDAPIYGEEVVEVFLDADGDGRTYDEIELSPVGVLFDASFEGPRQGMNLAWDSGADRAVVVDGTLSDASDHDRGWTAELAIPLARLHAVPRLPPRPGDRWRMNLYRLEWRDGRRLNEGYAFSPPLVPDFHAVSRFGWLELAP